MWRSGWDAAPVWRDLPQVHQCLYERMIPGEPLQFALPVEVGARISDLHDKEVGSQTVGEGHRSSHAGQHPILAGPAGDFGIDLAVVPSRPLHCLLRPGIVDPKDPVRNLEHQIHQRADGQTASQFAAFCATDTVGDHKTIAGLLGPARCLPFRQAGQQHVQIAT